MAQRLRFTKMQGLGNDFVVIDATREPMDFDAATIRRFIALLDGFGCDALVEVHDERELERAIEGGARVIGVNNRNLRDFGVDLAISERLGAAIPNGAIKVAESGIKSSRDVARLAAAGFHAFLVGESLLRQNDRAAAVRALVPE